MSKTEYTEADLLALRAQEGDNEAMMTLLENFGARGKHRPVGFIGKYYTMLVHNALDLYDKDTRRFIQLYIKDKTLHQDLVNRHVKGRAVGKAREMLEYISERTLAKMSEDDLIQNLTLLFIECVHKYEKTNRTFEAYIYNVYRYRIYELLRKRVFKYEWLHHPELVYLDETGRELADRRSKIEPGEWMRDGLYKQVLESDHLNLFWVNGRTAPLFQGLTTFERLILRDRYHQYDTDGTIAQRYGYHINTIYNHRHRAIAKLEDAIDQDKKES